jgi:4-oxalocrotonate tautomerase
MPLVQVTMVAGRTTAQKHALIAEVSKAVSATLDTPIDRVRVAIYEVSADEWGIGGVPHSIARGPRPAAQDAEPPTGPLASVTPLIPPEDSPDGEATS